MWGKWESMSFNFGIKYPIADKEQEQEIDFGFNKGLDNTFVDGGLRKLTNLK